MVLGYEEIKLPLMSKLKLIYKIFNSRNGLLPEHFMGILRSKHSDLNLRNELRLTETLFSTEYSYAKWTSENSKNDTND